jgi:formate dehydrogenase subunit gamma
LESEKKKTGADVTITVDIESDPRPETAATLESKILRFRKSERLMHWAIAIPFLVCFTSAAILFFVYTRDPRNHLRAVFSWTHRISGICFIVFPIAAAYYGRHDFKVHFRNILCAWRWTLSDIKWLLMMGLAAISDRFSLPEQGKFNAAEKINFMVVLTSYPLFILTGLIVWLPAIAFYSWLVHVALAIIATPLLLGHLFMAMINPGTRDGLEGIVTGFVDRQWAKHHYRHWYREEFEKEDPKTPVRVGCQACGEQHSRTRAELLAAIQDETQLECAGCGTAIRPAAVSEAAAAGPSDLR